MENVEFFDDDTSEYCESILNETRENMKNGVEWLRDWLDRNKSYKTRRDAYSLVRYLRACKYDNERAIQKLQAMCHMRSDVTEWFYKRDPTLPEIQELMKLGVFLPLLKRDSEGRAVILIRATAHNPSRHLQDDVFKTGLMVLDLFLDRFQDTSIHGVVAILDLNGVTYGHARQMTVSIIRKCVHAWQACYPVRIKSINFVNSPSYVNVVLNVFRQFMTTKLKNRVHVHGYDISSLQNHVPADILPPEYGGNGDNLDFLIDHWMKEILQAREWYEEDNNYRYIVEDTYKKLEL